MATTNNAITFKGNPLTILGTHLKVGDMFPTLTLSSQDMSDFSTTSLAGKPALYSIVPSLDTPTCSIETKRFNQEASALGNKVVIITISKDLPFAQKRWCAAEGASNLTVVSDYKYNQTGAATGTSIKEWALLCRAVFIADKAGKITYLEYVSDVSAEPDYAEALKALANTLE